MDRWVHFFAISKAQQLAIEGHLSATLSYRHGQKNLAVNHRENQPVPCAHQRNHKPGEELEARIIVAIPECPHTDTDNGGRNCDDLQWEILKCIVSYHLNPLIQHNIPQTGAPSNACLMILMTVDGFVMLSNDKQYRNAQSPII